MSSRVTELDIIRRFTTLSMNEPGFLFNTDCCMFYGNMLGILNISIIMGRKKYVSFPGSSVILGVFCGRSPVAVWNSSGGMEDFVL